jgi:hypothetical protein
MNTENVKASYEKYSDVMFVELAETPRGVGIDTVEVGESVGFPGQIVARFNAETGEVYGFVIERYSCVEKKLKREQAIRSARLALENLLQRIVEALKNCNPSMHLHLQAV